MSTEREWQDKVIETVVGLTLEEARKILEHNELVYRIVSIEDKLCMITNDVKFYRVNLTVKNNIVTKVNFG